MNHKLASIFTALLCIVLLAEGIHYAQWTSATELSPHGWSKEPNVIPYKLAALRGDLPLIKGETSLDFYRAIYPNQSDAVDTIELQINLPNEGQLEVWLTSPPRKVHQGNRWIDPCHNTPTSPRCGGKSKFGVGLRLDRIGEPGITALHANAQNERVINCDGTPPLLSDQTVKLKLEKIKRGLRYTIGSESIECKTQVGDRPPQIRPGLREVHIAQLSIDGEPIPLNTPARTSAYPLSSIFVAACWLLMNWVRTKPRYALLALSPTLTVPFLLMADWKSWIETMRAAWLPYQWMPVIITVGASSLLVLFTIAFQLSRNKLPRKLMLAGSALFVAHLPLMHYVQSEHSNIWLVILLITAVVYHLDKISESVRNGVFIISTFSVLGSIAGLFFEVNTRHALGSSALLFASFGGLAWLQAKARHIPGYNFLSIGLFGLIVVSSEGMLSGTVAGTQWSATGARTEKNDLFGWVGKANEGFQMLQQGNHTDYPDEGYPVAFPDDDGNKHRVVAFGGSTTGGAFQNDNLEQFYPSKLGRRLGPEYEIINQGVGGWTTFHIARYVEKQKDALRPDTAILYVGHNDLLTATPLPYKDLYQMWENNPQGKSMGSIFEKYHLYHALRHVLVSFRPASQRSAVPIEDAQDNLTRIINSFQSFHTKFLLVSEGLAPDPGPLSDYNDLLAQIALENERVTYLDAASKFHDYPSSKIFLDDCHLSDYGHDLLSQWLETEILNGGTYAPNP